MYIKFFEFIIFYMCNFCNKCYLFIIIIHTISVSTISIGEEWKKGQYLTIQSTISFVNRSWVLALFSRFFFKDLKSSYHHGVNWATCISLNYICFCIALLMLWEMTHAIFIWAFKKPFRRHMSAIRTKALIQLGPKLWGPKCD